MQSTAINVCMWGCQFVCLHISKTTRPNCSQIAQIMCGHCLDHLWRQCNILCTPVFEDERHVFT